MMSVSQRILCACLMLFMGTCIAEDTKKPLNYYVDTKIPENWKEHSDPDILYKEQWWHFNGLESAVQKAASPLCGHYNSDTSTDGYADAYRPEENKKPQRISEIVWVSPLEGGGLHVGDISITEKNLRADIKGQQPTKDLLEQISKDTSLMLVFRDGAIQAVKIPSRLHGECHFSMTLVEPGFLQSGKDLARYRTTVGGHDGGGAYFPSVFIAFPDEAQLRWFVAHELAIAIIPDQFGSHAGDLYKRFNEQVEKVFSRWSAKIEGSAEEKDFHKGVNTGPIVADYLSVYIGGNAGWSVEDFLKYLEKHRQYSIANEGARSDITPVAKQLSERLIRHWYQEMIAMKVNNQMVAPDPERTIKNMAELQ